MKIRTTLQLSPLPPPINKFIYEQDLKIPHICMNCLGLTLIAIAYLNPPQAIAPFDADRTEEVPEHISRHFPSLSTLILLYATSIGLVGSILISPKSSTLPVPISTWQTHRKATASQSFPFCQRNCVSKYGTTPLVRESYPSIETAIEAVSQVEERSSLWL